MYVMATDAEGVYRDWGTPTARRLRRTTPSELAQPNCTSAAAGPKVPPACEFVALSAA